VTKIDAHLAASLVRRFRLIRRLGEGGMGAVFLAEQIAVGNRPVALKVLNRKLLDDPDFLLRFQNEAASTGRIHHPNVVTIYESGQADDGTPYIAMEFLEGESLRQALARRGALPVPEVAEILQQAARGLNAAHKLGIIHRDLKPDNIFLTYPDDAAAPLVGAHDVGAGLVPALAVGIADTGRAQDPPLRPVVVKLVDFGIAKLRESGAHTQTGMVLGTPAYMSFEQASGIRSDQLDARSDIYSLGVVVYEMLTGRTPFHSDTPVGYLRMHMQEAPPPIRTVKPDLPALPQLEGAVMKALTKDRAQRYPSVLEFARAFAEAADAPKAVVGAVREPPLHDHGTLGQVPPSKTLRDSISGATGARATRLRLILWVGISAVALLLVLAGWYVSSSMHPRSGSPIRPASVQTPQEAVPTAAGTLKLNPKDGLKYVWIPSGTFTMGCSPGDTECADDEKPPHQVTITKGFWLGQTEVTVGAYKRFAAATGRHMPPEPKLRGRALNPGWGDEAMPIVDVTWDEAQAYCSWAGGRLPTEAEWEYAARAGSTAARYSDLNEIAWYGDNSGRQRLDSERIWKEDEANYEKRLNDNGNDMHDFGQKHANSFGLFDMLGNVYEWVNDWYDKKYYQSGPSQDPVGPTSAAEHVVRGGSWVDDPRDVRVSDRAGADPRTRYEFFGFRCIRNLAGQKVAASQSPTAASEQPPKPASQPRDTKADLALRHYSNGYALFSKNDFDGAITEFREAIRLKSDFADYHGLLCFALEQKRDWDGAISECRMAIRLKADYVMAHNALGLALEEKGELQPAIEEYRKAYELDPRNPTIRADYEKLVRRLSPQP
jgi:serine/threonine-protein kinase